MLFSFFLDTIVLMFVFPDIYRGIAPKLSKWPPGDFRGPMEALASVSETPGTEKEVGLQFPSQRL